MDLFLYFLEKCSDFSKDKGSRPEKKRNYHVSIRDQKDLHVEIEGKKF